MEWDFRVSFDYEMPVQLFQLFLPMHRLVFSLETMCAVQGSKDPLQ